MIGIVSSSPRAWRSCSSSVGSCSERPTSQACLVACLRDRRATTIANGRASAPDASRLPGGNYGTRPRSGASTARGQRARSRFLSPSEDVGGGGPDACRGHLAEWSRTAFRGQELRSSRLADGGGFRHWSLRLASTSKALPWPPAAPAKPNQASSATDAFPSRYCAHD